MLRNHGTFKVWLSVVGILDHSLVRVGYFLGGQTRILAIINRMWTLLFINKKDYFYQYRSCGSWSWSVGSVCFLTSRIRSVIFLYHTDPDPSSNKQESKESLDFYYFVTSCWLFIYENLFFVCILSATDEKSRIRSWIRICKSVVRTRGSGSGSVPKCHGSITLAFNALTVIDSRRNPIYMLFFVQVPVLHATNATEEEERKITVDDEMPPVHL
jgi:hypothetical protein